MAISSKVYPHPTISPNAVLDGLGGISCSSRGREDVGRQSTYVKHGADCRSIVMVVCGSIQLKKQKVAN